MSGNEYPPTGLRFFSHPAALHPAIKMYSYSSPLLPCAVIRFTPFSLPFTCIKGSTKLSRSISSKMFTNCCSDSNGERLTSSLMKSYKPVMSCSCQCFSSLCMMQFNAPLSRMSCSNNCTNVRLGTAAMRFSKNCEAARSLACSGFWNRSRGGWATLSYNNRRMDVLLGVNCRSDTSIVIFAISIGGISNQL